MNFHVQYCCMVAQEIQDRIFRTMSADKKLELGVQFWKLGKSLAADKFFYAGRGSARASRRHNKNAR